MRRKSIGHLALPEQTLSIIIPALNEEEHIEKLIGSIHGQDYRPIEVVVVDDGSSDDTVQIVSRLSRDLGNDALSVTLLKRSEFSSTRGPASARNVGITHSNGQCVLLIDADCQMTSTELAREIVSHLESHPIVGFMDAVIVDNWLERNQMLDEGNPPFATKPRWSHLAFRRDVLKGHQFDPSLGVQEDTDFLARLDVASKDVYIIEQVGGIHFPHTLKEYWRRRFWAGRTSWLYLRKYHESRLLANSLFRATPFVNLVVVFVLSLVQPLYSILLLVPWIGLDFYFLNKSNFKTPSRFVYLALRFSFGSCGYTCGLIKGFFDLYVQGVVNPSRGK